jgi:predicted nucleic acid-binding protein
LSEGKPIIVDTNILFSALLSSGSRFIRELLKPEHNFFICELVLVELFKYKEKIVKFSRLSEDNVIRFYYTLVKRLNIFKEDLIAKEHWFEARRLSKTLMRQIRRMWH